MRGSWFATFVLGSLAVCLGACGKSGGGSTMNAGGAGGAGAAGMGMSSGGASAAGGCGTQSFAAIYADLFANAAHRCAEMTACHGRDKSQLGGVGNLDLSSARAAYDGLVGVVSTGPLCGGDMKRVIAGNAMGSLLVQKLRANTLPCGATMPLPPGMPLSDPELQRIVDWINAGACDN